MDRQPLSTARVMARALGRMLLAAAVITGALAFAPARSLAPAAASVHRVDTTARTEADVRAMWQQLRPTYTGTPYVSLPSVTAPYATGSLRPEFLQDGLRTLNFARYLAGLPHDVVLNSTHMNIAQHGAVLLAASDFSHTPSKPADMSQTFYDTGLSSTRTSNIGSGYRDLEGFQRGCLDDDCSPSNLLRVGHRRWLLNPPMQMTGMGFANGYTTTHVFDRSRTQSVEYAAITWPSEGVFPVEFFSSQTPWSITLNPARYDWDTSGHRVTLRRVSDGMTWTFDSSHTNTAAHYFNADFLRMGVGNVFVFRPDPRAISYRPGDEFQVTLSGGIFWEGTRTPAVVSYRTRFMSLEAPAPSGPVTIEHDAAGVTFDRWVTGRSASYSGGGYVYSRWRDVWLEARFTGTQISWIGPKQPSYGIAEVYINGVLAETVDLYAPASSATLSAELFTWRSPTLSSEPHTIRIRVLGTRNPASSGTTVVLDRFEVTGEGASGGGVRLSDSGTQARLSGTWVRGDNQAYLGGSYQYSRHATASITVRFTGTRIAWIGPRTGNYGHVDVFINNVPQGPVCQFGPTGWRYRIWESEVLPRGTHTLELRVRGTRSSSSSGNTIVVDAFDVTP
ncbi:MAG TPA: hypothetical protein VFH17_04215 [Coriobacteriia bacterium]|nr:hypothetical protein [Coriobacteriia bacterium]